MSDGERFGRRASRRIGGVVSSPITLWAAFILAHLWLGLLNLYAPGLPLGDVTIVYKFWTDQALAADFWVGIDSVWVYPLLAHLPMLVSAAFGPSFYASTWLTLVLLLDAIAFAVLTGWGKSRAGSSVAWWWVGFVVLLGPIALGRIDSITVPIAIVGVLLLASRPRAAALLLAVATWIKVWPAALLAAIVVSSRERWRIVGVAAATSVAIVVFALLAGSGANVFSFFTSQAGRGLQVESPVSTIWMWLALAREPGAHVYYDNQILTYQVDGPGAAVASAVMTPLLAVVAIALSLLGVRAVRNKAAITEVLPPLALALVTALIAFNKVGSPQFISWLAVPVILGLAANAAGHGRSFRVPAVLVLVLAALTQAIYPYWYSLLIALEPGMLVVLTVRNLVLFVLLGWAVAALVRVGSGQTGHEELEAGDEWLPVSWPFTGRAKEYAGELPAERKE